MVATTAARCNCRLHIDDAEFLLNQRVHQWVKSHKEFKVIDLRFNVSGIGVHQRVRQFPVQELIKGDKPCQVLVHNGYNKYRWIDLHGVSAFMAVEPLFFLRERVNGVSKLEQVWQLSDDYRVLLREQLAFENSWCEACHGEVEVGSTVQAIDEQWADGNKQQVGESGCITFTPAK